MTYLSAGDQKALQGLEETLWRAETRFDRAWMDRILADDFFEFGRSGRIYNREQILIFSSDYIEAALPLPEFRARLLSADVAQVTYHSAVTVEGTVHYARRCSIWSRTSDGWRLRFHQGTPYETR